MRTMGLVLLLGSTASVHGRRISSEPSHRYAKSEQHESRQIDEIVDFLSESEQSQMNRRERGRNALKSCFLAFYSQALGLSRSRRVRSSAMKELPSPIMKRPVALVTGATKGIGLGIARGLAEKRYRVHITGRKLSGDGSLEAAAAAVKDAGGECITHVIDHADPKAIESLFDKVFAMEPDGIELLVNNVYPAVDSLGDVVRSGKSKFWQLPPQAFANVNDVGLTAHYTASALYAKEMVPRGHGLIVMVSSPGALFYFFTAAYSTGKAALDRLMSDFAYELQGTGIGCVGLYPGIVQTEKFKTFAKEGLLGITPEYLDTEGETPLFSGRAVAALAADLGSNAANLDKLSGSILWSAELAQKYGFTDEYGRQPLSGRALRKLTSLSFLPPSLVVPRWVLRVLSPRYPASGRETQLGPGRVAS